MYAVEGRHSETVVVLMFLVNDRYAFSAATMSYLKELCLRSARRPTRTIAVDVDMDDKEGRSATSHLKQNGNEGSSC